MAFATAVSGIKASSQDLGIIGNNIANSSTVGFKASTAQFSDVLAVSLSGAGQKSVGKGVTLSAVQQEFSQGNISFTSNALDLAINGSGFFVLSDGGVSAYSRAGNFHADKDGFIVNDTDKRLQGIQATDNGDLVGRVGDLKIVSGLISPQSTTEVDIAANLDARDQPPLLAWGGPFDAFGTPATAPDPDMYNASTSITVYDGQGVSHVMSMYFAKSSTLNEWDSYTLIDGVSVGGPDALAFQADGQFDPSSLPINLSVAGWTPLDAAGNPNGAATQGFNIDASRISQLGADFAVSSVSQDGFTTGQLRDLEIDSAGIMFARYTNGQSRQLAQVVLANFSSPSGLRSTAGTGWAETSESGAPVISIAGTAGLGLVQAGALEDSNVEITEQLVRMIVAQRNFQANAQVIQAEDSVTQTVINLR